MSDVILLTEAVAANPTDDTARLILADAIQEAGDETQAVAIRREVAALALREKLIASKVWLSKSAVYTLEIAKAEKGYAARQAETHLTRYPSALVFVYHNTAVTKTGLRKISSGNIIYYRKSSGGKWARSVQVHTVSL